MPLSSDSDLAYESIDVRGLWNCLARGCAQIIGLALLGFMLAVLISWSTTQVSFVPVSMRVAFAFSGFEKGQYPDGSKFQPDDLRSPAIVAEALKRLNFDNAIGVDGAIPANLSVEGIIPAEINKDYDRLRAVGQTPPPFVPYEYVISLTLPNSFPLTIAQRGLLLGEIVAVFREHFRHTYVELPTNFGNSFATLRNADPWEYELILNDEMRNLTEYLKQRQDAARLFRSVTTNLSFGDLVMQSDLFTQIQLNQVLGLISNNGLSKDRAIAMMKMNYALSSLDDQENEGVAEARVVQDLLAKSEEHAQNYILGIKSQASQPHAEMLDQGLIDSLLANDAHNFLVRRALDAGLNVARIQAEKARLSERREKMASFIKLNEVAQSNIIAQTQDALKALEGNYDDLIARIRSTQADFERQEFADAIRVTMQPAAPSLFRKFALLSLLGALLGLVGGVGLSLVGIYLGKSPGRKS
jgi:hypothetical protein